MKQTTIFATTLIAITAGTGMASAQTVDPAQTTDQGQGAPPAASLPPTVAPPPPPAAATDASQAAPARATATAPATVPAPPPPAAAPEKKESRWYDRIKIGGYTQLRYNRLLESNEELTTHGDKSVGKDGGLFLRRARLKIEGNVHDHLSIYLQPDFAASIGDQQNVAMMRDWYADIYFDKGKELRLRVGQSKIPFGFENLQSSQNRLPLDRADGLNTAQKDERDVGAFVYYSPRSIQKLFKHLTEAGLKGAGDYGMVGLGIYNGQGANSRERNSQPHVVGRVAVPFQIAGQIFELDAGGYTGRYVVSADADAVPGVRVGDDYRDARVFAGFILYPQPIGLQVEYNVGRGPQLDRANSVVRTRDLHGGYALASVKLGNVIPFVRVGQYEGGRKTDPNAPRNEIRELEAGVEWLVFKALELTAAYNVAERTSAKGVQEQGRFARIQVQFNY